MKTALNSASFGAVTAAPQSRWPHGRKVCFRGWCRGISAHLLCYVRQDQVACSRIQTGDKCWLRNWTGRKDHSTPQQQLVTTDHHKGHSWAWFFQFPFHKKERRSIADSDWLPDIISKSTDTLMTRSTVTQCERLAVSPDYDVFIVKTRYKSMSHLQNWTIYDAISGINQGEGEEEDCKHIALQNILPSPARSMQWRGKPARKMDDYYTECARYTVDSLLADTSLKQTANHLSMLNSTYLCVTELSLHFFKLFFRRTSQLYNRTENSTIWGQVQSSYGLLGSVRWLI